jgi:hypothetical protein
MPYTANPVDIRAGLIIPADGNYSIHISGLESFPSLPEILLEDLKTHTAQNLVQTPVYSFAATTTDDPNRFILHFNGPIGINEMSPEQAFDIYFSGNSIFISGKENRKLTGDVIIYNMMGQQMVHRKLSENALTKITLDAPPGYYLVKIITRNTTYTGKVYRD